MSVLVVLQSNVPVRISKGHNAPTPHTPVSRKCAGLRAGESLLSVWTGHVYQNANVPKHTFSGLVQDVAQFVFKVLRSNFARLMSTRTEIMQSHCTQRVQEVFPVLALVHCNLATSTADIRVDIKRFPQSINAVVSRTGANVQ